MSLRIRQIVLAARELDPTVDALEAVLGVGTAFRDPGVAEFGLHNAVMPIGDQFLEVVSPLRPGTAATRMLERRGEGGYMLLLQTDDLDRDRTRLSKLGVRMIWSAAHDDMRAVHLHPKDIGGTIVSLDQPNPPTSWRWGGPNWHDHVRPDGAQCVVAAEIEAVDPAAMARRWSQVLGVEKPTQRNDSWELALHGTLMRFVPAGPRGEGLSAFELEIASLPTALAAARSRGLAVVANTLTLGGARFELSSRAN